MQALPCAWGVQYVPISNLGDSLCKDWPAGAAWAEGYLSGLNLAAAAEHGKDALIAVSSEDLTRWLAAYCRANPDKYVSGGATTLFAELARRNKN